MNITLKPIGYINSTRKDIFDDNWDCEDTHIELIDDLTKESLFGIEDFSHVEIVFYMDKVDPNKIEMTARHPRNNTNWPKVGIFAQRGKNRPNPIGLTICKVLKVENKKLYLEGLDAIHGTPVLDIKPVMIEFLPRSIVTQPNWVSELMKSYWNK